MRPLALVWILAALLVQDDGRMRALLDKLDDDAIDVRSDAATALADLGAAAVGPLQQALKSASGERRERIAEILRRIQDRERLATLLPPPSRITLEAKDRPLREVLEGVARQTSTPLDLKQVASEDKVTVSLAGVPLWKALERICRASGKYAFETDGGKVVVGPGGFDLPARVSDRFRAVLLGIEILCEGSFGAQDEYEQSGLAMQVAWERGTRPWRIRAALSEMTDDKGNDLLGPPEEREEPYTGAIAPDAIRQDFALVAPRRPAPDSARLTRLKVEFVFEFPLKHAEVKFDLAAAPIPAEAQCAEFGASLLRLQRAQGMLAVDLKFVPRDARAEAVQEGITSETVSVRDKEGRTYAGVPQGSSTDDNGTKYMIIFPSVPEGAALVELAVRIPTEIHEERFDLDLKDVPLK